MLDTAGFEYTYKEVPFGEWFGVIKPAGTYGENAGLPIMEYPDGTYRRQAMAIMKSLAMDLGYSPKDSTVMYEVEWFFAMIIDIFEKPDRMAIT